MSSSDLGSDYIEDQSIDWGRVGRAVSGSVLAGIFISVIDLIAATRDLLTTAIDGFGEFLAEFLSTLVSPPAVEMSLGQLGAIGPFAFPVIVIVVMIAVYLGARLLIGILGMVV